MNSDEELVLAILRGDKSALSLFIKRYQELVVNTCFKVLHNLEDAEEAAQETFLEAYRKIALLRQSENLKLALLSIALSKAESMRRRRKITRFFSGDDMFDEANSVIDFTRIDNEESGNYDDPAGKLETEEKKQLILRALDSLPVNQRKAFIMHHFEDISYKEIAEMMKTSLSSVESLIFRALTSLKKRCSDFIEFEETVTKEIIK